jgi:hypothetical protein
VSDDTSPVDDDLSPAISRWLARAATWDSPPDELEGSVLAAISAEQDNLPISLEAARRRRVTGTLPRWLTAAAIVAVVAAGVAVVGKALSSDGPEGAAPVEISMAGTELAPAATAVATLSATPAGLKILLDAEGLPGAAPDEMYEAWVGDGTIRVSAGTFHLRGGDDPIELWAGVVEPGFHLLTVTREPVDGVAESSGQIVLRGEYTLTTG